MQIIISASLHKQLSINDINKKIREIEKSGQLKAINLKLNIDKNLTSSLNNLNNSLSQIAKSLNTVSASDNKMASTAQVATNNINKETTSIENQIRAMKQWNIEKQKTSQVSGRQTTTLGNNYNNDKQLITGIKDGAIKDIADVTNPKKDLADYNKMLNEAYKTNSNFNKKAEALDRDHYNALKTNKAQIAAYDKMHYQALKINADIYVKQYKALLDQADKIDRDHYTALKTNQQKIEAQDKQHYLALQQNAKKDLDYRQSITAMQNKINDVSRRYKGDPNVVTQLNGLSASLGNVKFAGFKNNLRDIENGLKGITAQASTATSHSLKFGEAFKTAFTKFPIWIIAANAFYAPLRFMQDSIKTIVLVDSQMTQLIRVMNQDTNFNKMLSKSINLANQLGQSVTAVNEAMISFARMGFDENQVVELAKSAVLAQNISEMSSTEATNALTAAMTVFNITAEDSIGIIDRINEIDNNFAVTSQNLAIALTKAGSSAKTFGVSMESLLGNSTAIMAATRESGAIVGNSLKTIYSRITTMSASKDILESVGISIHDMGGNVRSVTDILGELAGKFQSLSSEQQQNIGVTVAGRFQLNRFLALMSNWQMSLDATETALHSQGSALTENSKYMDSLAARIARMKSSWQELSIVMGEATITDTLVGLIGLATALGHSFAWLVGKVGLFPPVTTAATIALYLLSSAFRGLTLSIATSIAGLFGIVPATVAATTGVVGLTGAVRTLGITWRGFLASTGVGLAIGIGLEVLVSLFGSATKASDDFEGSLSTLSDTVAQVSRLAELQKEYSSLAKNVDLTTQEKIKLSQIESELQTKYGVALNALDSEHSAYLQNNNAIKQRIDLLKEEIKTEREKASLDYRKQESKVDADIAKGKKEADDAKKSYESLNYEYNQFKNNVANGGTVEKRLSESVGSYLPKIDASKSDEITKSSLKYLKETFAKDIDLARKNWESKSLEFQKAVNVAQLGLKSEFSNYVDEIKAQGVEIKSTTGLLFDALASVAAGNNLKFSDSQIASFFKLFNSSNIQSVEDAASLFKKLPPDLQLTGVELTDLNNALMKMAFGTVTDDMSGMTDGLSDMGDEVSGLGDLIKDSANEIKTINQAISDVTEGQSLNGEAVADLIVQYPELAKHIIKTADGWIIEKDALEEVRKAKVQKAIDDLENEKKSSMAAIDNSVARITAYQTELLAIQELANAKSELKTGLSDVVSDLYKPVEFNNNTFDPFGNPSDIFNKKNTVTDNGKSDIQKKIEQEEARLKSSSEKMKTYSEQIEALKKVLSDPNYGVSKDKSKSTKDPQEEAYKKELALLEFNADYFDYTTQQKIDGYNKLASHHKEFLARSLSDEQDLASKLKDLDQQRMKDKLSTQEKMYAKFQDQITASERKQIGLDETNPKYLKEQEKQIEIKQKWQDLLHKANLSLQKEQSTLKKTDPMFATLSEQIKKNSDTWWSLQESIIGTTKSLQDFKKDEMTKNLEIIRDKEIEYIDSVASAEDKRHEDYMDNKDAEMDKFQEAIDLVRKSMDRSNSEEDFNKDLSKLQTEESKIRQNISTISMDNSLEGQYKKEELEKELADKLTEIEQLRTDRSRELRSDNLDDMQDAKSKEIDAAKKSEDAQYKFNKDKLDGMKSDIENFWKSTLADENTYLQDQATIIATHLKQVEQSLKGFYTTASSLSGTIGDSLLTGLTGISNNTSNTPSNTSNTTPSISARGQAWQDYLANKKEAETLKNTDAKWKELKNKNEALRSTWGFQDGSYASLKDIQVLHTGGEVGVKGTSFKDWMATKGDEIFSKLRLGEVVLPNPAANIQSMMSKVMGNMNFIKPNLATAGTGDSRTYVTIENLSVSGGQAGADKLFDAIERGKKTRR
jgi:TP901 family phage tail tape measure protein